MGRRVAIDRALLVPVRVDPSWDVLDLGQTKGDAPVVTWCEPVFEEATTYGRAAAVRAIEAVWATGRAPTGAAILLSGPSSTSSRVVQAILEGAEDVFHGEGVPLLLGPRRSGPLRVGFAVSARTKRRRPKAPQPGDGVYLSRALGTDVLHAQYVAGDRTASQTRALVGAATVLEPRLRQRLLGAGPGALIDQRGVVGFCLSVARTWDLDVVLDASRLPALNGVTQALLAGAAPSSLDPNRRASGRGLSVARGVSEVAAKLALSAEWANGVLWMDVPSLPGWIGEVRKKRSTRPTVRLMASLDVRGLRD